MRTRFIPACAGNTKGKTRWTPPSAVHPRVCGEHVDLGVVGLALERFIPACAGNTRQRRPMRPCPAVHPRVCGEHSTTTNIRGFAAGSSPRVRGTPTRWTRSFARVPVHPRVCGEHRLGGHTPIGRGGSSPRVRGTPGASGRGAIPRRFIPACAGNTCASASVRRVCAVHPRVCGEHAWRSRRRPRVPGSSPRVRGTPDASGNDIDGFRFIPACAGNTGECSGSIPSPAVHPRVCGEHLPASATVADLIRFIPACAGNTIRSA